MELVTGIQMDGGVVLARGIGSHGREFSMPVSQLASRGLPRLRGHLRNVTTNLQEWKRCSFDEYAFAVGRPLASEPHQGAWSFVDGTERFVVPALALLRGLVRPGTTLFPRLFRPQSLEDLCSVSNDGGTLNVHLRRECGDQRVRSSVETPLRMSWLYCFPSARQAWASVYNEACRGWLDMLLPKARVTFGTYSLRAGRNAYVTRINPLTVDASEEPFPFAQGHPLSFSLVAQAKRGDKRSLQHPVKAEVPLRAGAVLVSDSEWETLRPIIENKRNSENSRAILDGMLLKLHSGATWELNAYPSGASRTATIAAYYRWNADGRFERVLSALRQLRQSYTS